MKKILFILCKPVWHKLPPLGLAYVCEHFRHEGWDADVLDLKGEKIVWDAQAIIRNDMPEKLLLNMKESGCFNLFIGLESGSQRTLNAMKKGFTVSEAETFFKKCASVGLHFETSIITGFPGETEEDFKETIDFIKRNRHIIPKIAQINPFIKYPGTDVDADRGYRRFGY